MYFKIMKAVFFISCILFCSSAWGLSEKSGLIYYPEDGAAIISMAAAAESRGYPATFKLIHAGSGTSTIYIISSGVTFSNLITLEFENGAMLSPSSGVTVTANLNEVDAGMSQHIFTGDGAVTSSTDSKGSPNWWGAIPNDSTDDEDAIQACLDACKETELQTGIYIASRLECNTGQNFYGQGQYASGIKLPDNATIVGGVWNGISNKEGDTNISVHDMFYDGNESNNTSWQGVIATYDDLHSSGINFNDNGPSPTATGPFSVYNMYIHDTLRNCISIQTTSEHVNINNVHLKNAALDHHLYVRTIAPANINNVFSEGFARRGFYALAGCQMTNITLTNTVENPYIAYSYVNNTNAIVSNRGTAGDEDYNEGVSIVNLTGYIDTDYTDVGLVQGGDTVRGSNFKNIRLYQTNASDDSTFTFLKLESGGDIEGLNTESIYLYDFNRNLRYLFADGVGASQLTCKNTYIRYRDDEDFSSDFEFLFRPDGTNWGWDISNFYVNTGYRLCQFGSSSTNTNILFHNINMPDAYWLDGSHPVDPNNADLYNVKITDSVFKNDGPDASVSAQLIWVDCKFWNKVEDGTTDGTTTSKLIDSTQNFLSTVSVGDVVYNTTDDTETYVTVVDSDTSLSLNSDYFVSGEGYIIVTPKLANNTSVETFSPDGSTSQFEVAHGLCDTPDTFSATVSGSGNNYIAYKVTATSTNLVVDFASNVSSGTDSLDIQWTASISPRSTF